MTRSKCMECEEPAMGRALCVKHYWQHRRAGTLPPTLRQRADRKPFTVDQLAQAMHDAQIGCGEDGMSWHYKETGPPLELHRADAERLLDALARSD